MTNDATMDAAPDRREYDRMLSGELYIADDPYLHTLGARRRRLQQLINTSDWDAFAERDRLFHELLGALGEGSHIEPPFRCDYGCNTRIGRDFYANADCIILDVAPVTIGDNVFFGPRVALYTPYHPIDAATRNEQLEGGLPIRIGSDVWFGGGVTVCPGVTIGDDVVVGAGSVVTKGIPSHSVAVGNPARVVRAIGEEDRAYWRARADEYRAWKDGR
ncbi:galactoside O-acetyltransferase [Bifidobacterium italicum]|uniref:Galactoside O-acetyltransferase n=1 Tax=Bifidobacterium italicum TaxID=1960968 RepID=A0A2A2EIJ3_9BIFI|nr:sugar O-acetyltransferase [Bifidobacterium italicum]PAU68873.1 galactoside O-acetyltransferase [Bifidobacterium italicum]